MIELSIESIRVSLMNYQRVVILKERESDRYLPIWIGPAEADAISVRLQEVSVARPLTHDLLQSVIDALGAKVIHILVHDLSNDTFFAKIFIEAAGQNMEIDSRPSDAIALAVRVKVPIFAEEAVLEKAGVRLDQEGQPIKGQNGLESEPTSRVKEEELEKLSPFRDVIEGLDFEGFSSKSS